MMRRQVVLSVQGAMLSTSIVLCALFSSGVGPASATRPVPNLGRRAFLPPLHGFAVIEVEESAEPLVALHGPVREDLLVSDEQLVAESLMRALSVVVLKILEGGRPEVRFAEEHREPKRSWRWVIASQSFRTLPCRAGSGAPSRCGATRTALSTRPASRSTAARRPRDLGRKRLVTTTEAILSSGQFRCQRSTAGRPSQ